MNKEEIKKCYNVKLYGTTVVGAKGQIVIPASVRKDLKIQPGDQLMVMVKLGKAIALVKSNEINELHEAIHQEMKGIKSLDELHSDAKTSMQNITDTKN